VGPRAFEHSNGGEIKFHPLLEVITLRSRLVDLKLVPVPSIRQYRKHIAEDLQNNIREKFRIRLGKRFQLLI
jgi:hypothetical protein